jgi:hypothetical protein
MASAIIPAGGAGAASYANDENTQTKEYKRIWSDKSTRDIVFDIITHITQMVQEDISPDELRFYAKGGNAIALLLERDTIPSIFPSDFDFSIDINPALSVKEYNKKQLLFIELVINYMIRKIKEACSSSRSRQQKPCIEIQSYNAHITPVNVELEKYIDTLPSDTKKQCSVDCPYRIFIRKNMLFRDIPQNRGVITLQKEFEGRFFDLFDIPIILRTTASYPVSNKIEEDILHHWNNLGFVVYDFPHTPTNHRLFINVYDPLSAYINMRIAAQSNTRENKRRRRTERANKLRNKILNPNWRTRILKETRKKGLPNYLKPILNNIKKFPENNVRGSTRSI